MAHSALNMAKKALDVAQDALVLAGKASNVSLDEEKMTQKKALEAVTFPKSLPDLIRACIFTFELFKDESVWAKRTTFDDSLVSFKLWALRAMATKSFDRDSDDGDWDAIFRVEDILQQLYYLLCSSTVESKRRDLSQKSIDNIELLLSELEIATYQSSMIFPTEFETTFSVSSYRDFQNYLEHLITDQKVEYLTMFGGDELWDNFFAYYEKGILTSLTTDSLGEIRQRLVRANLLRRHHFLLSFHEMSPPEKADYIYETEPGLYPRFSITQGQADNITSWRKHIVQNLRPYTCIATDCPTPDTLFSSADEWKRHFERDHPFVWICDECKEPEETFREEADYVKHKAASHGKCADEVFSSGCRTLGIRSCPLCPFSAPILSGAFENHVVRHAFDFALHAIPEQKLKDARARLFK